MSLSILEREAIRARWRRARGPLRLLNPEAEGFGTGGLARFVEDVGVRFLVLPADPELSVVRFDDVFWNWWAGEHPNPFAIGRPTNLGTQSIPTAQAAARFEQKNGRWEWSQYSALHRTGALELGLGHEGVHEGRSQTDEPARGFHLTRIVGRAWHAASVYREALARFPAISGPWELNLAMTGTQNARLGDVATGWADFESFNHRDLPRCQEPNLLFRLEIEEWPDEDGLREVAYQFGEMIEDAWAIKDRRWLIAPGKQGEGTFDGRRYG